MNMLDPRIEFLSRNSLDLWQLHNFNVYLPRLKKSIPLYKNLSLEKFNSLQDITNLPFTTKNDLFANYFNGIVPFEHIKRIHTSSGSSGNPTISYYSSNDLLLLGNLIKIGLLAAEVQENDIVCNSFGYGLFTGGLSFQLGCDSLNLFTIPAGNVDPLTQIKLIFSQKVTVLLGTPSGIYYLIETAKKNNIDLKNSLIRKIIIGGEIWSENLRNQINREFDNSDIFDIYGTSELIGPGVAFECDIKNGLHINENCFYPEIINPETLESVSNGQLGELVISAVNKELMPLIRYRTGDLTKLNNEKCNCGRSLVRIDRIKSRVGQLFKGISIADIENKILEFGGKPHFEVYLQNNLICFEVDTLSYSFRTLVEDSFRFWINEATNSKVNVKTLPFQTIPRTMGKAIRIK